MPSSPSPFHPRAARGFTLVEMMITVAIIAILASIALPAYTGYIQRSSAQEALQALAEGRTKMEQHFMDNRTYDGGCAKVSTSAGKFAVTCDADATTYTLRATGSGSMAGFGYTIDETNARSSDISKDGWNSGNCWITKPGDSCS